MKRFSSEARTLQWLDRRAGSALCLVLSLLRRLGPEREAGPVRSVLFLKLAEQGSTVLAHDAVRRAVLRFGAQNVYFLCFEENRFIVDLLGLVPAANVITIETRSAWRMAGSALRVMGDLRRRRIDACIDMEFFARFSAALAYLSGARVRVGFHVFFDEGPYRGDLMTHRVLYNPHLHTSRTFTSLFLALDADPASLPTFPVVPPECPPLPAFAPGESEVEEVRRLLAQASVPSDAPLVVLNANAGDLLPLRRWPSASYASLASRLLAKFPRLCVIFTGSVEEEPVVAELARSVGSRRSASLAGRTTLRQLLVLFGLSEALVTNDSGPAHFAALTGVDVVSLFGPETPLLFAAPGPRSHPLWAGIACSPCVNAFNNRQTACRDNACMQAIGVERVLAEVDAILASRLGAGTLRA